MNKKEAIQRFKDEELGAISLTDQPALDQAWNDWTDALCKNGEITDKQYGTWVHPKFSKIERVQAKIPKEGF